MNIDPTDVLIVQGIVDLAVVTENGTIIIDYKTGDFSSKQNLAKYTKQIDLYSTAIEKSFGIKVVKRAIVGIEQGEIYFI